MQAHTVLPLIALTSGVLTLIASVRYRLPEPLWGLSAALGLGSALIPSVSQHYASDRWDLAALLVVPAATFAANMFASRTRVAQLPLNWRGEVDLELGRLAART